MLSAKAFGGGPSSARTQSSACVLWLIICKTAKFQLANTLTSVIIIAGPILVFFIYSATAVLQTSPEDPPRDPTVNLTADVPSIYYSPKNRIVDEIIEDVAREVKAMETKGFTSADKLESALIEQSAFVGIEFEDSFHQITSMPDKVSVAVRYPSQLRATPKLRWDGRIYYKNMYLGTDYYLAESFLMVQVKLSEALIRAKRENAVLPEVQLKYFPEAKRMEGTFKESRVALCGFLFLPFAISSAYLAQVIIEDKQMWAMMRVRGWVHWLSWFIVAFLLFLVSTIFLVGLLKWRFYRMSNVFLVLVFFCVYIMELLSSALMIAAIFSDSIGVQLTILFLHMISWLPWRLMVLGYQATSNRTYLACLFLNSALALGLEKFIEHENLFMGMQWNMVFKRTDPNNTISLGIIMITMMLGTVLRILMLWYVEELKGAKSKKWYFPFQSLFCSRKARNRVNDVEQQEFQENQDHEPLSNRNRNIMVQTTNLEKTYNGHKVIRNISLNFYQDEITVFLGHNDSGKTTTFRMLAGIEQPDAGDITINGYDLATQERKALRSLSLCPQMNMFFDKLKVRWHIKFYCRLQGMNQKEASAEADKYLEIAHMEEFASKTVNVLSNGFKRMLALCCTLCGNSMVVLLDEPGTGMDPLMRRGMWDLLRKERKGRCIIMSTHNMLEAEVVADRIVIMCGGEVNGYGTTSFLTQIADSGAAYILICTKKDTCLVAEVTHFLQIRFPDIELVQEYGIYVTYRLPAKDVRQYSQLFLELEEAIDNLMLKEFSVRAPTLGDLFLRIGVELKSTRDTVVEMEGETRALPMWSLIDLLPSFEVREDNDRVKCCNQWLAIMERKIIFMCRHRCLFLLIILMPIFIASLHIIFELFQLWIDKTTREIKITDISHSTATLVLESKEDDAISEFYTRNAMLHGVSTQSTEGVPFGDYILERIKKDEMNYYRTIAAGATIDQVNRSIVAWANQKLEHGSALALGLVYESLALALAQLKIEIVNKPRENTIKEAVRALSLTTYMDFSFTAMLYLVVVTAIFAVTLVTERQTSLQHQQIASGMNRITYWLSHLFWDYCLYITMIPTLIIIAAIAQGSIGPITVLLLIFGFSVISFTYMFCLISNDLGKMFSIMMYVNMIGVLSFFIHPLRYQDRYKIFEDILRVHPHYALFNGVQDTVYKEGTLTVYHSLKMTGFSLKEQKRDNYNMVEIKYMVISGMVYLMMVLMSWIPRRLNYLFKSIKNEKIQPALDEEDAEVNLMRQRLEIITTKNYKSYPLIMKNVSKRYGDVVAVRALTLNINPYECVCLLGRNGAGKSSTFYMVMGKRSLTAGTLHIKGFSIKKRSKQGLKHVGFCPHEEMLTPYMTGWETLRFFCLINGIRQSHIPMVVRALVESFSLGTNMDKPIRTYSNGTKRKLMIAVAALAPTLLCLDEPTAGVDMYAKYEIWDILDSMRQGGRAILLTTHSMEECEILGSTLGILDRGTLLCYGNLARLRSRFDKGIFVRIKVGTRTELNILREEGLRFANRYNNSRTTLGSLKLSIHTVSMHDYEMHTDHSTSSEADIRDDYEGLLKVVEEWFLEDHPYSVVTEKFSFRGMITFVIPKENIRWSKIFGYMEGVKNQLQIMHYSISHTTLEDVFSDFVREHNK
ncbi:phospholipid-transporting ATPase ABCA3 [Drosophila kikkawai]|uniref:Phospholipid-transporting ATPase ABCA3 n=1 Tax=Drosophila kikkawai TaxID=30033 RepID=A0A6P4JJ38_DROKI|nr:retinal-specific phospholipid-transporting ATPase ABCA4 isoform X2 [Drosophila kikkawai]